jgi:predicted DNA binding CopG/RHH family protein
VENVQISGFQWDEGNRAKCQKHGISVETIESLFQHPVAILPDETHSQKEQRFRAIGKTEDGRSVFMMKKKIPTFKTDQEAENFVATADLSKYNLSGARLVKFELKPKNKSISLRLPEDLFRAVQEKAKREGIPYQRLIRQAIEREVL